MTVTPALPELLAGRYRLGRALGEGGMAKVFWAWDELLRVERAVKVLQPEAEESPLLRTRLLAEATAMARLNHPNVLRVMDLNADHSPPFVVMELAALTALGEAAALGWMLFEPFITRGSSLGGMPQDARSRLFVRALARAVGSPTLSASSAPPAAWAQNPISAMSIPEE